MNDEQLLKVIEGHVRRRGYRSVSEIRREVMATLRRQGADESAAQTFVDMAICDVPVQQIVLTSSTQLSHAYARMEADLESGAEDLREALVLDVEDP